MIQEQRLKILVLWIRSRDGLLVEVRRRIQMMYSQHSLVKHHSFNSIYEYSTQKINKKLNIRIYILNWVVIILIIHLLAWYVKVMYKLLKNLYYFEIHM